MNRKAFFDAVRADQFLFKGALTAEQVSGMSAILDEWDRRALTDLRWLAYMLATPFHETAGTMQPVIETRQPSEKSNPSVDEAIRRLESAWAKGQMPWVRTAYWRKDAQGLSWLGRGLPQVTHRVNYLWAEKATGIPFTKNPDLMLVMGNAVPVMFIGMIEGKFTGHKLRDYFNGTVANWREARRIINSTESADKAALYGKQFHLALLKAAQAKPQPAAVPAPAPQPAVVAPAKPPDPKPQPQPISQQPPQGGFFIRWLQALTGKR